MPENNETQPTVESLQNDESETETSSEQSEAVAE